MIGRILLHFVGPFWRAIFCAVMVTGLLLLGSYCPMMAKGGTCCCMAANGCSHNTPDHKTNSNSHPAGGCNLLACCTAIGIMPGIEGYQGHMARGDMQVAWTIPQLESWSIGVVFRPPRV